MHHGILRRSEVSTHQISSDVQVISLSLGQLIKSILLRIRETTVGHPDVTYTTRRLDNRNETH